MIAPCLSLAGGDPGILLSVPFIGGAFYMIWNPSPELSATSLIVWMSIAVLLFYTAMTAFVVPHTSLGAELTTFYHERTRIFGVRHITWNIGSLLALVAMHQLIVGDQPRRDCFLCHSDCHPGHDDSCFLDDYPDSGKT